MNCERLVGFREQKRQSQLGQDGFRVRPEFETHF